MEMMGSIIKLVIIYHFMMRKSNLAWIYRNLVKKRGYKRQIWIRRMVEIN